MLHLIAGALDCWRTRELFSAQRSCAVLAQSRVSGNSAQRSCAVTGYFLLALCAVLAQSRIVFRTTKLCSYWLFSACVVCSACKSQELLFISAQRSCAVTGYFLLALYAVARKHRIAIRGSINTPEQLRRCFQSVRSYLISRFVWCCIFVPVEQHHPIFLRWSIHVSK